MDAVTDSELFAEILPRVHAFRSLDALKGHYSHRDDLVPVLTALHLLKAFYNRHAISEENWTLVADRSNMDVASLKDLVDDYVSRAVPRAVREWVEAPVPKPSMKRVALRYLVMTPDIQRGVRVGEDSDEDLSYLP